MFKEPLMSKYSPFLKSISFLLILLATLLFANLLGILLAIPLFGKELIFNPSILSELSNPHVVTFLKFSQLLSQLGMLAAAIIFAYSRLFKYKENATKSNSSFGSNFNFNFNSFHQLVKLHQ